MPVFFQGSSTTLSASSSGTLRIRLSVDGEIIQFLVNSTGRAQIDNLEITGVADFFDGTMELNQFKQYGNTYTLPEPIPISRGSDIVVSLTDISGASNKVYFGVAIRTG